MTKYFFAILFISLFGGSAIAQEILTMPGYNKAVAEHYLNWQSVKNSAAAITLPFYDDFSVISVAPSPSRWADAFVFVNTDYAKYPPSIGVATLDALDDKGALYPNAGPNSFDADYLTSLPIRLDSIFSPLHKAITRSDSVYFSFYYQPQGRTISPPSKKASLLLEFHSPGDNDTLINGNDTTYEPRWNLQWTTDGGVQVDTFAKPDNQYFRRVLIPITRKADSALYYKNGFQFRFHNIAALMGNSQPDWRNNGSHWNLDVVYLATGRSSHDTVLKDMAFADLAPSMLRNYEAMPFRQYRKNFINEMKDTLSVSIANLDNQNRNVSYKYDVRKNSLAPFFTYNGGSFTISPFAIDGYSDYKPFAKPPVNFLFPISNEDKVVFHIIHTLTPDPNPLYRSNDTIHFVQEFSNYYAYDNGSSEAGIGINNATGSYAVQFKLNDADTLRGMQIYYNPVIGGSNLNPIDLNVWNDAFGKPGQVIKTLSGITPINSGNLNEFIRYWFETPQLIDPVTFPGLIFYIGWTQSSLENLNVGFDRYKDSHIKRFYNVDGTWEMSSAINYGSVMMRPIVGPENPLVIQKLNEIQHLAIQPNPVTDGNLIINIPESWKNTSESQLEINIISSSGSRVFSGSFSNPINVAAFSPGFYMVLLTDKESGKKANGKLIIR
jgi:hypothetical protein